MGNAGAAGGRTSFGKITSVQVGNAGLAGSLALAVGQVNGNPIITEMFSAVNEPAGGTAQIKQQTNFGYLTGYSGGANANGTGQAATFINGWVGLVAPAQSILGKPWLDNVLSTSGGGGGGWETVGDTGGAGGSGAGIPELGTYPYGGSLISLAGGAGATSVAGGAGAGLDYVLSGRLLGGTGGGGGCGPITGFFGTDGGKGGLGGGGGGGGGGGLDYTASSGGTTGSKGGDGGNGLIIVIEN